MATVKTSNNLVEQGENKITWARNKMPVLQSISERWKENQPLKGVRVSACLHVTPKTANLLITLKDGGAEVALCGSNPLSTQDDVVAALNEVYQVPTHAKRGEGKEDFYNRILEVLDIKPHITVDDGADLINTLHSERRELLDNISGGTEETTTGVTRLKAMARDNYLQYPVIAVNDAMTKHMFDNRYGTGQSTIDGIMRATNYLMAGTSFVVVGYGWCGRGVAKDASGLGARVTVVEVDPVRALEASLDGFEVKSMEEAAKNADFVVTTTGNKNVVDKHHLENIKDGCILSNSGHFNVEINLESLEKMSKTKRTVRPDVEEYQLKDGRKVYVIGEGRLVNLSAGEGHPADVMDMSFSNQALSVEYLANEKTNLKNDVYPVPKHLDEGIAELKLKCMGMELEQLTEEQKEYLNSWDVGT
ncbi:adenosylhomocysteinase [Natranaerobius thermophilus]|uniref:Adenosylhomocysteinase n=1 Tax=Natranaerobius thermophilus (strain ATCC BAA-1301 / DSM 18059 / JW/NM-WN-LF) TaxID=457570 RepID=B2A772_NATTJ|nr:adenosylhomocysteinase [Natranaerobius thermophilus]ACB84266.1 adenosylhomocysteinase [Natranaerobius thermophilus JW/NM-WN-LF]